LGVTQYLPQEDKQTYTREYFIARLVVLLGGRVAEELAMGRMTTGASNDLERASALARNMVTRYGMSELLGPLTYGQQGDPIFLGREIAVQHDYSEDTAQRIDSEVRRLVTEAYATSKRLIGAHMDALAALCDLLVEKETVTADEVIEICREAILAEGLTPPQPGSSVRFSDDPAPAAKDAPEPSPAPAS
jgi:cell division protease FtsH